MKKLILVITFIFLLFNISSTSADCVYSSGSSTAENLEKCLQDTLLLKPIDEITPTGFAQFVQTWTNNIALFLGVFAVFGIILGAFMMTISAGEEDKISKAKDIIKWSLIGFIALITATLIVNLIVRIMYSIG